MMKSASMVRWTGSLVCGLVFLFAATGCAGRPREKDYLPAEPQARAALEAALSAWKNGEPAGKIEGQPKPIQVIDNQWQKGRKLESYQILKAEPGSGPIWFSVELQMKDAPAKLEVRYVVIGSNPLWVYREED